MNMNILESFIEEFKNYMDVKLYVQLFTVSRNYRLIDCEKESYQILEALKQAMRKNKHFKNYRIKIKKLEKALRLETQITSPKQLQNELKSLSDNPDCFSKEELETEIAKYENQTITRLIKKFKNTNSISRFIGLHNLANIIITAIPTPKTVGLNYNYWDEKSFKEYVELYFHLKSTNKTFLQLDKIKSELCKSPGYYNKENNLLNFYASQEKLFSFYYLYFIEIQFEKNNCSDRQDRRYNKCFIMFVIDIEALTKNKRKISTSFNNDMEIPDLEYYFDKAYEYTKKDREDNGTCIPVFLFHTNFNNDYMESFYHNLKEIPSYRLLILNDYAETQNISKISNSQKSPSSDFLQLLNGSLEIIADTESEIEKESKNFSDYTEKENYIQRISDIWDKKLNFL